MTLMAIELFYISRINIRELLTGNGEWGKEAILKKNVSNQL